MSLLITPQTDMKETINTHLPPQIRCACFLINNIVHGHNMPRSVFWVVRATQGFHSKNQVS